MIELPATTSNIEALWIAGSFLGLCGTLVFIAVIAKTAWIIVRYIRVGQLTWSGPRWNYVLGMLVAMLLFLPGWLAFFALGVVVAGLPPNPYIDPDIPDLVGYIILSGMLCFACGQAALVFSWFRVRYVTATVWTFPPAPPVPDRSSPPEVPHA